MPRTPGFGGFTELRLITNYYLLGCTPPFDLVIETSKEPGADLLLLFIGFDPEQWFQTIFEPGRGRRRGPARKGRKRPRGPGIPDWNAYFAGRVRQALPGFDGIKIGPTRWLFRLWAVADFVQFSAAVLEGVTDIAFAHLWGVFKLDPENCQQLGRFGRSLGSPISVGGGGQPIWPINMQVEEFNTNFGAVSAFTATPNFGPGVVAFEIGCRNLQSVTVSGRLIIYDPGLNILRESGLIVLDPGETFFGSISADVAQGQAVAWGWRTVSGTVTIFQGASLGFLTEAVPWWGD
jgi:hypothetical protein